MISNNSGETTKQKILLISPIFPPELYMSASLTQEMAEELTSRRYEVVVFTTVPSRPGGKTLPGYNSHTFVNKTSQNGYNVIRVRSWQIGQKRTRINRIMENLIFGLISSCYLLFSQRYDRVISIPWPNIGAMLQAMATKIRNIPYYYFIMDLLPEQAESAGLMLRGSMAYRLLLWIDKVACRSSAGILTLSAGLKKHIAVSREVPENKILLTTIQVNPEFLKPNNTDYSWKSQFAIPDDAFLILYSGTLGYVSGIDILVDVMEKISDSKRIFFLIIGEGPLAQTMKDLADRYPARMRYLPFQPKELFHTILYSADMTLVTMNPQSGIGSVPSKMYTYMAAGKPILAAVPSDSEVERLVKFVQCGRVVAPGDAKLILQATLELMGDCTRLKTMGIKGKTYVKRYCNVNNNVDAIEAFWERGEVAIEKDA